MTEDSIIRCRCPHCNHLREGFTHSRPQFYSNEVVVFTTYCRNCKRKFETSFRLFKIKNGIVCIDEVES